MSAAVHVPLPLLLRQFEHERMAWLEEAARFFAKGEDENRHYCQGRAAAFNDVIVRLGGEGINLSMSQFEK